MTIIVIENASGSGRAVTVAETFETQTIDRNLRPGESARLLLSPFRSIVIHEAALAAAAPASAATASFSATQPSYVPIRMTMRGNDD